MTSSMLQCKIYPQDKKKLRTSLKQQIFVLLVPGICSERSKLMYEIHLKCLDKSSLSLQAKLAVMLAVIIFRESEKPPH